MDLDFIFRAVQSVKVKYMNETWGNYRIIEGTKTINDWKNGHAANRAEQILKYYRKDLPVINRVQVAFMYEFHKIFYNVMSILRKHKNTLSKTLKK